MELNSFTDPLVARSCRLPLSVRDPYGVWPVLETAFEGRSTLPPRLWLLPAGVDRTLPMAIDSVLPPQPATSGAGTGAAVESHGVQYNMSQLQCAALPDSDPLFAFPSLPIYWYRAPYVHVYVVRLEPGDWTAPGPPTAAGKRQTLADSIRAALKEWVDDVTERGLEWIVVYAPSPAGRASKSFVDSVRSFLRQQQHAGTSLGASFYASTFASLRSDIGRRAAHRFIRLDEFEAWQRGPMPQRLATAAAAVAAATAASTSSPATTPPVGTSSTAVGGAGPSTAAAGRGLAGLGVAAAFPSFRVPGSTAAAPSPVNTGFLSTFTPATDLPPLSPDTAAAIRDQWAEFNALLTATVYDALTRRVQQHLEEGRKLYAQSGVPGWNFCNYFCVKESLAFIFAQVRLPQEALRCYVELQTMFQSVAKPLSRSKGSMEGAARVRAALAGDDGDDPLMRAWRASPAIARLAKAPGPGGDGSIGAAASQGSHGAAGGAPRRGIGARLEAETLFQRLPTLREVWESMATVVGVSDRCV